MKNWCGLTILNCSQRFNVMSQIHLKTPKMPAEA